MEYKAVAVGAPEVSDDRVVKQIFSVAGTIDRVGDRIMPGAFAKTLQERFPTGEIKVLWQHESYDPPIGVPLVLKELSVEQLPPALRSMYPDATGALYGEVQYLDTPRGNEVLAGIRAGAITQNSIGFDIMKWDVEEDDDGDDIRILRELRLWDVSPVVWPAQQATMNLKTLDVGGWDELSRHEQQRAIALVEQLQQATPALQVVSLSELAKGLRDTEILTKAGRVLSTANVEKLKAALEALHEILTAAEPHDDEGGDTSADEKALTERRVKFLLQQIEIGERELALYT